MILRYSIKNLAPGPGPEHGNCFHTNTHALFLEQHHQQQIVPLLNCAPEKNLKYERNFIFTFVWLHTFSTDSGNWHHLTRAVRVRHLEFKINQ